MYSTPVKQYSSKRKEHAVCILCSNVAKEPRNVESSKTKHNIKDLLLKYGGINVESGKMCAICVGKLYSLHEKSMAFYNFCQASYKTNIHQTKRMASSPSERLSKMKTINETPTKRYCSRIPTPVKVNVTSTPKPETNLHLTFSSPPEEPVPVFGRASLRDRETPRGKKCLFADSDSSVSTLLATSFENIAGKKFLNRYNIDLHVHIENAHASICKQSNQSLLCDQCYFKNIRVHICVCMCAFACVYNNEYSILLHCIAYSAVGNVSGNRCESDCRSRVREFDPGPFPYFRRD